MIEYKYVQKQVLCVTSFEIVLKQHKYKGTEILVLRNIYIYIYSMLYIQVKVLTIKDRVYVNT